jgi:hypothetical protein
VECKEGISGNAQPKNGIEDMKPVLHFGRATNVSSVRCEDPEMLNVDLIFTGLSFDVLTLHVARQHSACATRQQVERGSRLFFGTLFFGNALLHRASSSLTPKEIPRSHNMDTPYKQQIF